MNNSHLVPITKQPETLYNLTEIHLPDTVLKYAKAVFIMKPTSRTRRASPLARTDIHPHFTWEFIWRASSSKRARHLDISRNFLLLWIKIINEQCIGANVSDPPARASPLCCVYMEDFQPS